MADSLGLHEDAVHWKELESEWPDFATDATGLCIAPHYPLQQSHRHLSHLLAIHPFGLLDISQGKDVERLIRRSIHHYEDLGAEGWCGYSYSWLANLQARVQNGDAAARSLHIFIKAFCSPNSFHLNGDQLKKRLFWFDLSAFHAGRQFCLRFCHPRNAVAKPYGGSACVSRCAPSIGRMPLFATCVPSGAFLVSASMEGGRITYITVRSEKGGRLKIWNPFTDQIEEKALKAGECISIVQ